VTDTESAESKLRRLRATGDPQLRDEVIAKYTGLARALAGRFAGHGEPLEDLTQVALMGLVSAVDRFDPEHGVTLSTFASSTILGTLKRHFRDRSWTVRLPRRVHDLYLQTQRAVDDLGQELGRPPTLDELSEALGVSMEEVIEAMEAGSMRRLTSLEAPSDEAPAIERHVGAIDPELAMADQRLSLPALLNRLPERQRQIVELRFLEGLPQHQIAMRIGISQMHVSRLLSRSLDALRAWASEG
jgi:RNA polymerase sigma-B factor